MITLYQQTKTSISFWCRQELNPKSLIQLKEILPIKLTGTHRITAIQFYCKETLILHYASGHYYFVMVALNLVIFI